jgi:hypothetical protein
VNHAPFSCLSQFSQTLPLLVAALPICTNFAKTAMTGYFPLFREIHSRLPRLPGHFRLLREKRWTFFRSPPARIATHSRSEALRARSGPLRDKANGRVGAIFAIAVHVEITAVRGERFEGFQFADGETSQRRRFDGARQISSLSSFFGRRPHPA